MLFDLVAARDKVACLCDQQGVAPIYFDRLLFELRSVRFLSSFNPLANYAPLAEGKQYVRDVHDWQGRFLRLIHSCNCAPVVRLVTIVAYYEACECSISNSRLYCMCLFFLAACDPDTHLSLPLVQLSQEIFEDVKGNLNGVLAVHKHRDFPRVISLLRPLTRHQILRERILTQDVFETFVELLDVIIHQTEGNFRQAMNGLICVLQYGESVIIVHLETR